jgi:hypothetical protein
MTRRQTTMRNLICCAVILSLAALVGCAGKKTAIKTSDGVILQYRMAEGKAMMYEKTETSTQSMKVMGQAMDTETNKTTAFTVEPKGLIEGKHGLTITIDSMEAGLKTPQGSFTADTESAVGESFDMMLSAQGKEMGLDGADGIEYNLGMAGTRSIRPDFEAFFPDLPGERVKIWDTWTTQDTIDVADSGMDVRIISENLNVLEGYETVNGRDCAKVTVDVTGSVTGEGMQGGANLEFGGEMTGKETWYFDYAAGVFVKSSSDLSVVATVNISGPQEMTIPVSQSMTITAALME